MKKDKKEQSKGSVGQIIVMLFFITVGACAGVLMAKYLDTRNPDGSSLKEIIPEFLLLMVVLYLALFLQTIIHEGGHLVFGLLTGYRFSSFRIGSLMLVMENGKLRRKKLSVAGTGGQCLMEPPPMKDGMFPYVLYNAGGVICNLISAVLFVCLSFPLRQYAFVWAFCMVMGIVGAGSALINGIPLHAGGIDNDGYNILSLGKFPEGRRAFWLQMRMNGEIAAGKRLKDMPEEWFEIPSAEAMKNSMAAAMGVFACNRLMDEMKFSEADRLMEKLLGMDTGIIGLHRSMMKTDQIYCELIGENRQERLEKLMDKNQRKFMKSMKSFPSVLRTEYAYALLHEKDKSKAEKLRQQFEKMAKKYPYPNEINGEREFMECCRLLAEKE